MGSQRISRFTRLILLALVGIATLACGPTVLYSGPRRAPDQVAVIVNSKRWEDRTELLIVDGQEIPNSEGGLSQEFEVLPGEHTVMVSCYRGRGLATEIIFEAEAGHTYEIMSHEPRVGGWVVRMIMARPFEPNTWAPVVVDLTPESGP